MARAEPGYTLRFTQELADPFHDRRYVFSIFPVYNHADRETVRKQGILKGKALER